MIALVVVGECGEMAALRPSLHIPYLYTRVTVIPTGGRNLIIAALLPFNRSRDLIIAALLPFDRNRNLIIAALLPFDRSRD